MTVPRPAPTLSSAGAGGGQRITRSGVGRELGPIGKEAFSNINNDGLPEQG